ncbi:MAG: hypothetical protein CL663_01985 [Bacteroidetes bacterium]|nr:hypothetical protein [Bacteroidota bacterium]
MNQVFDIKRFTLLARLKFSLHKNALGLSIAGYYALLFIIGFFIAYAHRNDASASFEGFHYVCMGLMMILGGVVLAGRAFQDMNTSEKSNFQIMTPASNLEKLILPLISTSIGWLLFSYISYVIFALLFNGIWSAAFGIHFEFFAGTEMFKIEYFGDQVLGFFVMHSVYLLGSAAFKKYPIVKTILTQFIINWGMMLVALLGIIVFFGSIEDFGNKMDSMDKFILEQNLELLEQNARTIFRILGFLLMAALYTTAYYKLREREV